MNGVQLALRRCDRLTSTTSSTIATLRITMTLLTRADSRIPITNTADITATMRAAGRLMMGPGAAGGSSVGVVLTVAIVVPLAVVGRPALRGGSCTAAVAPAQRGGGPTALSCRRT